MSNIGVQLHENPLSWHRRLQRGPFRCNLQLWIRDAEEIDKSKPVGDPRLYRVYAWVVPGSEYRTHVTLGSPNPYWDFEETIPMGRYGKYKFLHLDVCRELSKSDPGTSTGQALVGRARIPLPRVGQRSQGRAKLMKWEDKGEVENGCIWIAMQVDPERRFGVMNR